MILKNKILLEELIKQSNNFYPDRIKFCIHKPTQTISIDREFHIDMEYELIDEVGESGNIFGGDIILDPIGVVWEAHPNIDRNRELGMPSNGRLLTDERLIGELFEILKKWIVQGGKDDRGRMEFVIDFLTVV